MPHDRIVRDPKVLFGKPVIRGTRISVEMVLEELGMGRTVAELLHSYPCLAEADIHAAQAFAAEFLATNGMMAADGRAAFIDGNRSCRLE